MADGQGAGTNRPSVAEENWNAKFLALCDSVGEDLKRLIFEELTALV